MASAIVDVIRRSNRDVQVIDRGAYLRVLCPGGCRLSRAAVEEALRRPFVLPGDLELVMSSFKGHLRVTDDEARWEVFAAGPLPAGS